MRIHPRPLIHGGVLATAFLVIAALTAGSGSARAQDATGTHGPVAKSITGSAHWLTPDGIYRRFIFTSREYADGTIDGEWNLVAGATILHGTITCMNILSPSEARLGGRIDSAKFATFQVGTDLGWVAVDNGQGEGAPEDMTSNLRAFRNAPPGSAERFCQFGELPFPDSNLGIDSITHGNTKIHLN